MSKMVQAFDGSWVPEYLPKMPCGGVPEFDDGSGCAYRCMKCGAVIGSVSQPRECIRLNKQTEKPTVTDAVESESAPVFDTPFINGL